MSRLLCDGPPVSSWRIVREDAPTAAAQMRVDETLAQRGEPVFRLFQWSTPACSLGYRQARPAWLSESACAEAGVDVVERPTGGGIAVHGSDLSCSVTLPAECGVSIRETVARTAGSVTRALATCGVRSQWVEETAQPVRIDYCLTQPSPYAILIGSRKVCGFAIRRYPSSWLVQGSLLLRRIPEVCERLMPQAVAREFLTRAMSVEEAASVSVSDEVVAAAIVSAWDEVWSESGVA